MFTQVLLLICHNKKEKVPFFWRNGLHIITLKTSAHGTRTNTQPGNNSRCTRVARDVFLEAISSNG